MKVIKYLLSFNRYSRNGTKTNNPKGIVLHHAQNERCSAIETRNYFENLKIGKNAVYYSTHYIVGLEGEIIYCVPEEEVANHRGNGEVSNGYISITCCNIKNTDEPQGNSIISIKALVRDIAKRYGFKIEEDFLRHYDVSGMKCPLFYVENQGKWRSLKEEILEEENISRKLTKHSSEFAEGLSRVTGIEKKYLQSVLEEKSELDLTAISKILTALNEEIEK